MIVLLSGKQGSGKTSIQKKLVAEWINRGKRGVTCVNFADIIYEMHDAVLKVLYEYWPDRNLKKDGPLLQLLGTEWGRNTIDTNIWVKCLQSKIEKMRAKLIIIGDCRFENEFDGFPEALRIRLVCPESVRRARCEMWRENTGHPSEVGLDSYADAGKFDMRFDTDVTSVEDCVSAILAEIARRETA